MFSKHLSKIQIDLEEFVNSALSDKIEHKLLEPLDICLQYTDLKRFISF